MDVVVVGAGIAGISAARVMHSAGLSVQVVEVTSGPGGRMASVEIGGATFDHGAQFFTTRGPEFTSIVDSAVAAGAVKKWCDGFDDPPDGFPRYRGSESMADLVRWMATGIDVRYDTEVLNLRDFPADGYVISAPVGEGLALVESSGIAIAPDLVADLGSLGYKPTIAVLLLLDIVPEMAPHGGKQYEPGEDLAFVTDNQRKGISSVPAVTLHLSNELSGQMWSSADDVIVQAALRLVAESLDEHSVIGSRVHRWSAAGPVRVHPERTVVFGENPVVALAGEIFGGPKVEGAFLSGLAAGAAMTTRLA